jgi:SHS2 domain-containing protein
MDRDTDGKGDGDAEGEGGSGPRPHAHSGPYTHSGHRTVPHTADLRIEAWAESREQCLAEAVSAMVESFADLSGARPTTVRRARFADDRDEELLAALLEEVVFRLEVHGEVPVDVDVRTGGGGSDVRLAMTGVDTVPQIGAAPKAVAWNELHMAPDADGWRCAVTVDV